MFTAQKQADGFSATDTDTAVTAASESALPMYQSVDFAKAELLDRVIIYLTINQPEVNTDKLYEFIKHAFTIKQALLDTGLTKKPLPSTQLLRFIGEFDGLACKDVNAKALLQCLVTTTFDEFSLALKTAKEKTRPLLSDLAELVLAQLPVSAASASAAAQTANSACGSGAASSDDVTPALPLLTDINLIKATVLDQLITYLLVTEKSKLDATKWHHFITYAVTLRNELLNSWLSGKSLDTIPQFIVLQAVAGSLQCSDKAALDMVLEYVKNIESLADLLRIFERMLDSKYFRAKSDLKNVLATIHVQLSLAVEAPSDAVAENAITPKGGIIQSDIMLFTRPGISAEQQRELATLDAAVKRVSEHNTSLQQTRLQLNKDTDALRQLLTPLKARLATQGINEPLTSASLSSDHCAATNADNAEFCADETDSPSQEALDLALFSTLTPGASNEMQKSMRDTMQKLIRENDTIAKEVAALKAEKAHLVERYARICQILYSSTSDMHATARLPSQTATSAASASAVPTPAPV